MSVRNFQDLYVANLAHRTSVIRDQIETGLYMLKRVGFFLRKIATAKKACSVQLNQFSDHELEKKERISKDAMRLHVNAYQQMQHVCTQMAFFELKYGNDLLERIAEPLLAWHKEAEIRFKKIVAAEEKLEASLTALKTKLKNERQLCLKGWTDLTKEYKDWQKSLNGGDAKKIEKFEKNFIGKREKLRAAFLRFEQMVDAGNAEQRAYWTKELPQVLTNYELLEVERCNELEARMVDFRTIQSEYSQPFPGMLSMIDQAVKGINGQAELRGFVESVVVSGGRPEPPVNFVDGLPADSRALLDQANQNTLGALLNQEPTTLAAQREAQQLKQAGNCVGTVIGEASRTHTIAGIPEPAPATSAATAAPAASPASASPSSAAAPAAIAGGNSFAASSPPAASPTASSSSSSAAVVPAAAALGLAGGAAAVAASSSDPSAASPSAPSSSAAPAAAAAGSSSFASGSGDDPFDRASDPEVTFVRALYDFTSEDPDDLTFTLNTVIRVTLKGEDEELATEAEQAPEEEAEPRWWRGQRLENIGKSRDGTFPSNYVRVVGVERDMSLRHLLEIPSGLRVFSEFLRGEYAAENIQFWSAVEGFRELCSQHLLADSGEIADGGRGVCLASAERIAREFIGGSAAQQVNISSATLKITQDRLVALPASLSLNMFDEAASEIMKMLSADSFARFKRHELFERYLATPLPAAQ